MRLASFLEKHKSITLSGTKRFSEKSGEYYLKNVILEKKNNEKKKLCKKLSLTKPQNLNDCINKCKGIKPIEKRASKIITKLPENSLTPIPINKKNNIKNCFDKKELNDAERIAVFIRRYEYSTSIKNDGYQTNNNDKTQKIILIQQWWKTIFKIIFIQKFFRGFLSRKKLMNLLEIQEKFIDQLIFIDNLYKKIFVRKITLKLKKFFRMKSIQNFVLNLKKIILKRYFNQFKGKNDFIIKKKKIANMILKTKKKRTKYFLKKWKKNLNKEKN